MTQLQSQPQSNAMRDRAMNYLAAGLSETATASALGVTIPLISSYMAEEGFAEQVRAKRLEAAKHSEELHNNYASAQLKLSQKLTNMVNTDYPWTPLELIKVSETLDKMQEKYRPQKPSDAATAQLNMVNIFMPASMVAKYTTNVNNEIIAVDDKLLRTINSQQLIKDLTQLESETSNDNSADLDKLLEASSSLQAPPQAIYKFSSLPTRAGEAAARKTNSAKLLELDQI